MSTMFFPIETQRETETQYADGAILLAELLTKPARVSIPEPKLDRRCAGCGTPLDDQGNHIRLNAQGNRISEKEFWDASWARR